MSECAFDLVLEEWAKSEWEEYADAPVFKTSKKHDRAMQRIFKLYERNTRKLRPQAEIRVRAIRRRIAVALIVIVLAVITGFTAAYFISRSFRGEVHSDHTELFPIDTENCPVVIEDEYYLSDPTRELEIISSNLNQFSMTKIYKNKQTEKTITFEQWTKTGFDSSNFNTEKGELNEVEINGKYGLLLETRSNDHIRTSIIWDNGDYVLYISSEIAKNELMNLAKSTKIK